MAVYFVLGGSGRGKSYFVNHTIVERAQAEKDKTFLMIVPEQATMQTQKEIVGISEQQGIMNIEVQSFVRLAYRIFGETGTANLPALDDMGKTLILHKVLLEQEKNLHYFGKNVHKKGYVAEIKSFLSEMMQYGIDEEGLEDMIQSAGSRMALKSKLEDMKVAYRSFRAYLKDNYITSEEVLTVLSGVVSQSVLLKDAVICLDGFTGFTPVQYQLIEELMRVCSDIYVTVTMDEAQEIFQPGEKHELFYLSKKTTAHFLHMIRENGIEEPEIIRVGKEIGKTRFHGSDQLQHLEQSLFRFPVKSFHKGDAEGTGDEREDISIHLLKQPQQEISFVVGCIKKLRREGYRYRDIAVVAGDMEVYGPLARDIFGQAQIPCFVDQKKTILANPLVNMLDALIDMIQYDFRYDTVIRYLRGKYSMLGMEETDLLDNYLLASGIRGAGRWKKEWDAVGIYRLRDEEQGRELNQKLNDIRQKVWNNIQEIYSRIKTRKHTVREFAEALVQFMEEQDFYGKLTEDVEVFRQMGDAGSAKEYDQIYGIVLDVLDRLVELLGEEKMSLKEFRELLDTGFSEARVGLIPPGVDQIVVGDLTRTRLDHVKHLFFLGATDANIPSGTGGGGILSASERSFLEQEDFEMAPTERQKIYTEQFYLYLTLTKPEEHLYLCLCEVGNDGKEQKPAYLIDRVRRLYPDISVHVEEQCQDAVRILGQDRGMTYLIKGLRDRSFEDSRWQQIYSYYKEHKPEELQKILEAAFYQPEKAKLVRENAKLLYGDTLYGSASRFELYASCAYRHFLQYGLRLEERQERTVEFYDIGNVIHETLELYTKDLILHNRKWQDVPSDERKQKAEEYFRQVAEQYKNGLLQDTARNHYLMKTMKRVLHRTIAAISSQMGQGNFETVSSELRFEQLHGPLRLQGSVDRVDQMSGEDAEYITIVDYKTGDKDVSLSDFYYGLQMQLVIYLQAAVDAAKEKTENWKKIIPAGIFYFHPQDPILESVDAKDKEKKLIKEFRMKGLLNESDPVVEGIGGDGVTSTKKCVAEKEFDYFMRYTQDTLEKMSEDILGGTIEVNPYRRENDKTPCEYCPYHGVCQFDPRLGNKYRSLIKLKDEQVYMELKEKYDKEETTE